MKIPFIKMQGLGNDFVVIDDLRKAEADQAPLSPELARRICDRRFGIGADQILWLKRPQSTPSADARMEILNADGSVAEMCGNGIRAVGLYLERNSNSKPSYVIETLGGVKVVSLRDGLVTVDMGPPGLGNGAIEKTGEELVLADGQKFRFYEVSMGNPHAVIFVDSVDEVPLEKVGPMIENHPRFPKRTNVEFVQVESLNSIRIRVWERGAGITLACGTGACASAVATFTTAQGTQPLAVHLPGGKLTIAWGGPGQSVMMEGPAEEVFRGEFQI